MRTGLDPGFSPPYNLLNCTESAAEIQALEILTMEVIMNNRPGCLQGLLRLALLNWIFDFLQERFGFGRGCSCTGIGCGFILLILFLVFSCSILTGTNWFSAW